MKRWDALVVGSGISSLTCAAILAKKGRSVCVIEQHTKPGGYLHCFKRFGARFDTGAHYVGAMNPGEPFHNLLSYLGVYDSSLFVALNDQFDELQFPSFQSRIVRGYANTIEELSSQFPHEKEGLCNYFQLVEDTAKRFPTYHYRDEYDEFELKTVLETSLRQVVESYIKDPRLQCVLYAYCSLHGVQPEDVAFGLHTLVTDSLIKGAYGFRSGGDALAEKYVEVIRVNGGEVVLNCTVESLKAKDGIVTEVITDRGSYTADWVISGIHPKSTFRLVSDPETHFRPAFLQRIRSLPESGGVMGVYAMCNDVSRFRSDRNYYFFGSENPREFLKPKLSERGPSVAFVTRADRIPSPGPSSPLLFHSPGPMSWYDEWRSSTFGKRCPTYNAFKDSQAKAVMGFVERFNPGLQSHIERYSVSTPVTNLHFNGSEEGSAYGIYHSISHSGARALGPRTHLKNLMLTGQSCLFPGLFGAATSGLRSAGSVLGIKPILRELMQMREGAVTV